MTERVPQSVRGMVRQRAKARCEYCGLPDSFGYYAHQVDHILPVKHQGSSEFDNLAWASFECNNAKGSDIAAYDTQTGALTPLFNPRTQAWNEHFTLRNGELVGLTPFGRVTVGVLRINQAERIEIRRTLVEAGLWETPD